MSMLTLKIYPDRLYVYQRDNLIVRGTIDLMTGIRISKIRITPKCFLFSVKKPGTKMGYLPIDKTGADLLFQVISPRYERGSLIITSNRLTFAIFEKKRPFRRIGKTSL